MKKKGVDTFLACARRQCGFSLIELMIIIAILGTLSAVAVPNILSYRDNARLRAAASQMLATFRKAQVVAVKRNYNTGLLLDVAAGTATVFLDNGAGAFTNNSLQDTGEPTIDVFTLPAGCKLFGDTFGGQTGFSPRGLPLNIGAVEVHSTRASAKAQYKTSLSLAGHTKIEISTDGGTSWQ